MHINNVVPMMKTNQPEVPDAVMRRLVDSVMNGNFEDKNTLRVMGMLIRDIRGNFSLSPTQKTQIVIACALKIIVTAGTGLIGFIGYKNVGLMFKIVSDNFYAIAKSEEEARDGTTPSSSTPQDRPPS